MDKYNTFHTRSTYLFERLDYAVIMIFMLAAVAINWRTVDWLWFVLSFLIIDLIGTVPGMYWYYGKRKGERRRIPQACYALYNIAHSFVTVGLITLVWYMLLGRWDWAMLGMPIHLCGDRSVFGNTYKPFSLSFEPVAHNAYTDFQNSFSKTDRW